MYFSPLSISSLLPPSVFHLPPPPPPSPTQAIESEEREREKEWNRRRIAEARAGLVLEAQLQRCKKDELKKLAQENRQMAEEQLAR